MSILTINTDIVNLFLFVLSFVFNYFYHLFVYFYHFRTVIKLFLLHLPLHHHINQYFISHHNFLYIVFFLLIKVKHISSFRMVIIQITDNLMFRICIVPLFMSAFTFNHVPSLFRLTSRRSHRPSHCNKICHNPV